MFSTYGRRNYDQDAIRAHQGLLHVLDHAGVGVLWRDNQSGCKGVCDGLPMDQLSSSDDPQWCNGHRCLDEIMLKDLDRRIDAVTGDMVVVLHQLGNHGPSYFERYPAEFDRFNPTCDTAELGDCTVEQVVNTYDNALLYTDHFIAETVRLLARRGDRDTALVYVSDHGESLGEYGLYLHGMPWAIAPREQTKVPMVMWVSEGFANGVGLDRSCLDEAARLPVTHDWLFHTVLGLMKVSTALYDPAFDVTAGCRPSPGDGAVVGRPSGEPPATIGSG
jgi:lipid A ethanolaminephosphotransferase